MARDFKKHGVLSFFFSTRIRYQHFLIFYSHLMSSSSLNCYKILELDKETATINDIKKAYRRLALKYHPDKQPTDATEEEKKKANEAFQRMGKAYAVLSDPKRKERYDRTGSMDESEFEGEKDWTAYFKELWDGVVSAETIEAQAQKYRGIYIYLP